MARSSFPARYKSKCGVDCGELIHPADEIIYVGTLLVHLDCMEAAKQNG